MTEIIEREKRIMEVEGYRVCCFCQKQRPLDQELCGCFEEGQNIKYGKLDISAQGFADSLFEYHRVKYALHIIEGITLGDKDKDLADMDFAPVMEAKKAVREKVGDIRMYLTMFFDEWEKIKNDNGS